MNAELRHRLAELTKLSPDRLVWPHVVVLHNCGWVPTHTGFVDGAAPGRGFNLLLVDGSGQATHFVKCRSITDNGLRREGEVLAALAASPLAAGAFPPGGTGVVGGMRFVVTPYATGPTLRTEIERTRGDGWGALTERIVEAGARVCRAVAEHDGEDASPPPPIADLAAPAIETLLRFGLEAEAAAALERCLQTAPPYRPVPQHGDLWVSNVVRDGADWWIIDFERFGEVSVPMYDAVHLIRSATLTYSHDISRPERTFLDVMESGGREARTAQRLFSGCAARHGFSAHDMAPLFAFHVVDISAIVLKRGLLSPQWKEHYLRELRQLARLCRSPERFGRWLCGDESAHGIHTSEPAVATSGPR